jgi:hypothetical protein
MYQQIGIMAAKAAWSAGKTAVELGTKLIEVAIPVVQTASKISVTFIRGGVEAVSKEVVRQQLSKPLPVVENELSVPLSFSGNQFLTFSQEIKSDLNIIKGQNEMLFLSNSIGYFIESHAMRTGIDRGISYALQYDMAAVRTYLKKNRDLRFPGYLLHQCTSLGATVKEMNIFYTSLLNQGAVPDFTKESVDQEFSTRFGAKQQLGSIRSYIPYELQLPHLRAFAEEKKKNAKFMSSLFGSDSDFDIDEINDVAHEALFILNEELIANEQLEHQVSRLITTLPQKRLLIESRPVENS